MWIFLVDSVLEFFGYKVIPSIDDTQKPIGPIWMSLVDSVLDSLGYNVIPSIDDI